jgi:hypothetical protein
VATDPTLALAEALALLKFGENLGMPSTGYLDKWIEITLIRNRERQLAEALALLKFRDAIYWILD